MQRTGGLVSSIVVVASLSAFLGTFPGSADAVALSVQAIPTGCDHLAWTGHDAAHRSQIYVSAPDGTGRVEISTADNASADPAASDTPRWSPDGARIMWMGAPSGVTRPHIFIADPDGLNRIDITVLGANPPTSNANPSWSPDSTRVAWSGRDPITNGLEIWMANSDGTARSSISNIGIGPPTLNARPAWSPDGTKIAWQGSVGGVRHVFVANADGSNRIDVIDPAETEHFGVPKWAPDGSMLAFNRMATLTSGGDAVFTVTPDGSGFTQVWQAAQEPLAHANPPVWSPDSSRLAFTAVTAALVDALMVVNPDGTGLVDVGMVPPPATPITTISDPPHWSPTGGEIAFGGYTGARQQLYISKIDGSAVTEISTVGPAPIPAAASTSIDWSPDGLAIAWRGSVSGDEEIFVAAGDGSSRVIVSRALAGTVPMHNDQPAWQPRFSSLALTTDLMVPTLSKPGTFSATVTNTGPCPAGGVRVDNVGAPCLAPTGHLTSHGSLVGSTWSIGTLAPGASASLTITGSGTAPLACGITAGLGVAPASSAPVTSRVAAVVEPCPAGSDAFVDVPPSSFARDEITCLSLLGITTGTGATTYEPGKAVSREEMASVLTRTWQTLGETCPTASDPFVDVSPTSFARDDITCIFNLGITTGTSAATYDPSGEVTREQMAAFLARLWRLRGGSCPAGADPFVDVSPTSFARDDITCIFNLGITTGTSAATYDPSGEVTREQMAAFLVLLVRRT